MKKALQLVPALLLLTSLAGKGTPYSDIFAEDYSEARSFVLENQQTIQAVCDKYQVGTELATSIVFPELIRYSLLKDFFETQTLKVVYTEFGAGYADFSIGVFQMKPSFAETLENYVKSSRLLSGKYKDLYAYPESDGKAMRGERVNRLQSLQWQLTYLCAFVDAVGEFHQTAFDSFDHKLKFFASAYNSGFLQGAEKIEKYMVQNYFPYGKNYHGKQYPYCEISLYYYKNELLTLKSESHE